MTIWSYFTPIPPRLYSVRRRVRSAIFIHITPRFLRIERDWPTDIRPSFLSILRELSLWISIFRSSNLRELEESSSRLTSAHTSCPTTRFLSIVLLSLCTSIERLTCERYSGNVDFSYFNQATSHTMPLFVEGISRKREIAIFRPSLLGLEETRA